MSEALFPSGPWTGFYNYGPGDRHRMQLHLSFAGGRMSGDGVDDVGRFLIKGRYDTANKECHWTKTYPGSHDVFYRGFREGKGIWGTWEISIRWHGGFHIWPRAAGEGEEHAEMAASEEPVDAIAKEAVAGEGAPDLKALRLLGSSLLTCFCGGAQDGKHWPPVQRGTGISRKVVLSILPVALRGRAGRSTTLRGTL